MNNMVIVFVADAKFLQHTKALAVNCRREGQSCCDFLWIVPDDMHAPDVYDLTSRGALVLPVRDRGFLMKFNLFDPMLQRWKYPVNRIWYVTRFSFAMQNHQRQKYNCRRLY